LSDLPTYPENDLDQGRRLLRQLGSFWSEIFGDREVLRTHLRSSAQEQAQVQLAFTEAVASVSRFTVPVFHREDWHLLTFLRSQAEDTPSIYRSGDLVYGPQDGTVVNRPEGFVQAYGGTDVPGQVRLPLPDDLADIKTNLQNVLLDPSRVLVKGLDFDIRQRVGGRIIRFREDPFEDDLIPRRDIVDEDGNVVDTEIALWAYQGDFDLDHIYTHFGYAIGLKLESSQFYKDLLNAVWDAFVLGFSRAGMEGFLSAMAGAPIVLNPRETVEVVRDEGDAKLIVTDTNVYRAAPGATVTVSVGDELTAGTSLTDAFELIELGGHAPSLGALPALALSKNFLSGGYFAELMLQNAKAELEFRGLDDDGKAFVCFEVTGFPGDIDRFWELAQQRGKDAGATLAELLDTRENPAGQPGESDLPAEVNPLDFVLDNIMKNNLFVMRVRTGSFDEDAPGLRVFRLLRDVIPPHTTYVVFVELVPAQETVDLSVTGGEDEPGAEVSAGTFHGTSLVIDEAYEEESAPAGELLTYNEMIVAVRQVSLTCH